MPDRLAENARVVVDQHNTGLAHWAGQRDAA
jgi:hypothetical protein